MRLFSDSESEKVLNKFTSNVKQIGREIEERNGVVTKKPGEYYGRKKEGQKIWKRPYKYLLPANVPSGITY